MENLKRVIQEHPFAKGLNEGHLDLIAGCALNVRYNAGDFIFHEGDEANHFYLIRHGKVALETSVPGRPPLTIQTLCDGDILGWSWLIPPYFWLYDVRVIELTRAIALDGKCLRKKCEDDHDLGYELLKSFSKIMEEGLQATRLQLLDVYGRAHS